MDRFLPTPFAPIWPQWFDEFAGALTKICHTGTVREYQTKFENLVKHTKGFSNAFYRSCFISGLKDTTRSKVNMFCPNTMMEILGLAKLTKDKIGAHQRPKSTFVPFRIWFPKEIQSLQLLDPLLSSICLKSRCRNVRKNGFVIIVMRNSLKDITTYTMK